MFCTYLQYLSCHYNHCPWPKTPTTQLLWCVKCHSTNSVYWVCCVSVLRAGQQFLPVNSLSWFISLSISQDSTTGFVSCQTIVKDVSTVWGMTACFGWWRFTRSVFDYTSRTARLKSIRCLTNCMVPDLMCPAFSTLHPWCVGALDDTLSQFVLNFRVMCVWTWKAQHELQCCPEMPYKWLNVLRFVASVNCWTIVEINIQVLKMRLHSETSKQIIWQILWCYWSNQTSLGFMINFPQQGRELFTHNSPVMKECSRHQLLFSTFSTEHSVFVPTQTQGSMSLECQVFFSSSYKNGYFILWKIRALHRTLLQGTQLVWKRMCPPFCRFAQHSASVVLFHHINMLNTS